MDEQLYEKISRPFRKNPKRKQLFQAVNRLLVMVVYLAYIGAIYVSYQKGIKELTASILIPGISFVLLSAFRSYYNAPRPYEELAIVPLTPKDTKGKSFPSRHVFSAFLIVGVVWSLSKVFGVLLFVIACLIAASRVIGGVHYPKDVIAGGVSGLCFWIVGSFLFF